MGRRARISACRDGGFHAWSPAIFNLNGPAHYVHWHFFQMSVANLVVIGLMIVVFILAIVLPFPKREIEE